MTTRKPKPAVITARLGKASVTIPAELLPILVGLAPAARQAGEALTRVRATIERTSKG